MRSPAGPALAGAAAAAAPPPLAWAAPAAVPGAAAGGGDTCRKPSPTASTVALSRDRYTSTPGRSAAISGTWPGRIPISPSAPGALISSTSASTTAPRGVVTERRIRRSPSPRSGVRLGDLLGVRAHLVEPALHVDGLLRQVVALAGDDLLEAGHGVLDLDVAPGAAGEGLGHVERLRQEALDLARARHGHLVVLGQLVHAQDGDDVLELFVLLQHLLHGARRLV